MVQKVLKPILLDPLQLREAQKLRALVDTCGPTLSCIRQYSRLTIAIDDLSDAQILAAGSELLKPYDIIAATPGNIKVFSYLCKQADVDIIALDFTHRIPFAINKKSVGT